MFKFKNIKLYVIYLVLLCLFACCYVIVNNEVSFLYVNPYTETSGFSKISRTVKSLDKAFDFVKQNSAKEGYDIKYIFKNAYGSGFLKNNPIPNDLDFAIGVYLGEYTYDGENADEIADSVVNKMDSFQYLFNSYVNSLRDGSLYVDKNVFQVLAGNAALHKKNADSIALSIPLILKGKDYVRYTQKPMDGKADSKKVELPYFLKSNEILIEDYSPISLYSDSVSYNDEMPQYLRTISVIPEFFVKIKTDDKEVIAEIIPEAFLGERLQLSRRFFASTVFVDFVSGKYVKNLSYMKNDDDYFFYRLFSYKRHLQEISNLRLIKDRPVKMLKRVMQTADIISPAIAPETYQQISDLVYKNLSDKDIQLLNEYSNICTNLFLIQESPTLFLRLMGERKIKVMYDYMTKCLDELEMRGNVNPEVITKLKEFQSLELQKMFLLKTGAEVVAFRSIIFSPELGDVQSLINKAIYDKISGKDELNKIVNIFNKVYTDAGFHKVTLYWLDENTMGIQNIPFTRSIDDLKKFAKENKLADVNYKLLKPNEDPVVPVKYSVWVRYNPSETEQANYLKLRKALLDDKKNFNMKYKFTFTY